MNFITQHDIDSVYTMKECIADLKEGFRLYSQNKTYAPVRTVLDHSHSGANTLFMPSYIEDMEYETVKVVSIFPNNPAAGISTLQGVILLTETVHGQHLATIEASGLTVMRTGAGAGVATEYLAKKDARQLSILGCGAQSRGQLQAVLSIRPIDRIFLWNRTEEKALAFKEEIEQSGWKGDVIVSDTANDAASKADVLSLSSKSQEALFDANVLKPGVHINAIGSYRPDLKEFGVDTLERLDQLWVDTLEGVQHEAGELIQAADHGKWTWDQVNGELAELVTGQKSGRRNHDEITLYKSVGVAYMDTIAAAKVYEKMVQN
ncbi:ornithine cyclodeaminase family protein [Halobacillus naozhouensis]|uniref:Ornithine cyclodeaminase family protein n=1 Tax=Halobacillus naozhouensis TaxID=554880 RepID=A0ABY8J407_9BACI|nr:ornithine cyclodeaminase family protein [Halobacillus naozhouensis]WFT75686.1 ornithine cyclodeaminase family protein [Halobacillus naozhouensis]